MTEGNTDLILLGVSFKTARMELRERMSLADEEIEVLLPKIREQDGVRECAVVSTCNRTEIYATCAEGVREETLIDFFMRYKSISGAEYREAFYCKRNIEAARHLFRVSSGLESQMVGENQVQSQLKSAYSMALALGTTAEGINRLFHMAFRAGKLVRSKTDLGAGAVSISSAAVELAGYIYETLSDKSVLLIGAGETGELVAKHLLTRGVGRMFIANRTREGAEELARRYGAEVINFDAIAGEFFRNDIVITATASREHILTVSKLKEHADRAASRKVMAIDISMPRDIDPAVGDFDNVFLYDMDDLKSVVDRNIALRIKEIPHAEKIVEDVVGEYVAWRGGQRVVPTIKFLKEHFENIRAAEIENHKFCGECSRRTEVDYLTRRIINKILNSPIKRLMSDTGCSEEELAYLRGLFGGEGEEDEEGSGLRGKE